MKLHHQRAHIHDGLKHLSDRELIQKVREAPTQLKKSAKSFLKKLQKYGVELDGEGELDLSNVELANVKEYIKKNETLVKITLMQADLEFEYPHKLERMQARADVLELAEKEEEKLDFAEFAKAAEEARKKILNYEDYFEVDMTKEAHVRRKELLKHKRGEKAMTFEQYVDDKALTNTLFDMDLIDLDYKFWESEEDKKERLKLLWIDLKRKNAIGGVDKRTSREQTSLNQEIVDLTRRIRWRVDQELTRRSIDPLFKENYYSYDKDEFLMDADFEFVKIKNLLSKNPKMLKEDPVLSIDYLKIINLIKKKKLLEKTTDQFDPTAAMETHHYDVSYQEKLLKMQRHQKREQFAEGFDESIGGGAGGGLDDYDRSLDEQVKKDKKSEAKKQLKLLKQFDQMASEF
mmetsp:Transcript_36958/g.56607  ORF Transcript_36958/g.56607 Transcript_36958/m.56607 type:complete len:404 (+) Transcript_36958:405-1616(+)